MIVSLFACFVAISNHHMTPAHTIGIYGSDECTSDKRNACSQFPGVTLVNHTDGLFRNKLKGLVFELPVQLTPPQQTRALN